MSVKSLRVIGDVHAQILPEDVLRRGARSYLELIEGAAHTIQIGDMGDEESYAQLQSRVDPLRHRFIPGNHEHYHGLPPHSLGDFGSTDGGGVSFFFVRGAASKDRERLQQLGRQIKKTLWFEQEELTDAVMLEAERAYLAAKPAIMLTHEAPTEIARFAWHHARELHRPDANAAYRVSRTSEFLARLWAQHAPRLWVFGHYHRDWRYKQDATQFVCVGELASVEINEEGVLST